MFLEKKLIIFLKIKTKQNINLLPRITHTCGWFQVSLGWLEFNFQYPSEFQLLDWFYSNCW
jgi:hypothetical protein